MPSDTFYNLSEDKRNRVINVMKKEFSRASFEEASVNTIVKEADIAKGSFYQYFKDKDEAINYLIENYLDVENKIVKIIIQNNNGDVFNSTIDFYNQLCTICLGEQNNRLMENIYKSLITDKEKNIFSMQSKVDRNSFSTDISDIKGYIEYKNLKAYSDEQLEYLLKLLSDTVRVAIIETLSNKITYEQGKARVMYQINIIRNGGALT